MGNNLRLSSSASGTKNIGQGGGANLRMANVFAPAYSQSISARTVAKPAKSTADYYHADGLSGLRPYDLNAMGSWGQAIATAKGYRYVWLFAANHIENNYWGCDAAAVYAGFSNDPGVLPDPSTVRAILTQIDVTVPGMGGNGHGNSCQYPCLVYNPDDATNPAYLYTECIENSGGPLSNAFHTILSKNSSFDSVFTVVGISHAATVGGGTPGFVALQQVIRVSTGVWVSYGGGSTTSNNGSTSKWTSTDGVTFTNGSLYNKAVGTYSFANPSQTGPQFSVSGTTYVMAPGSDSGVGNYIYQVAVDSGGNVLSTPTPVRLSDRYLQTYPGPTFLIYLYGYVEDGVFHAYADHGYFSDTSLVLGALYENGGGLDEEYIDRYSFIVDASAAVNAAPVGVTATCSAGVVTISWDDALPNNTYRVKRGTDGVTFGTTVGTISGVTITDSPTVGSVYYYQVITMNSGVEQASRVVSTYVN